MTERNLLGRFIKGHIPPQEIRDKISQTKRVGTKFPDKQATCKHCKREFVFRPNSWLPTRVFCSKKCKNEGGSMTGKTWSKEARERISKQYKGNGNPIWRGGISFKRYRGGDSNLKHKKWRELVFERDNYTCQKCRAKNGNGKRVVLNADHIKPLALCSKEEMWSLENGQTLCKRCHREKTNWELKHYWRNQYGVSSNVPKKPKV